MDQHQFAARVAELEQLARSAPRAYRVRVLLFALLGYGYLALVVLLLIALLIASAISVVVLKALAFKIVILLGGFVALLLRAMWVEIAAPRGIVLRAADAPQLFARLEQLRRTLRAPRFHRVLVTDEFNAGVAQQPRLGPFGWPRNYLLLGLPLMKCLSAAQLEAVIAHELGHLSGGHARFGNRLYRLRMIWTQLRDELDRRGSRGAFLFKGFFDWYVPRFNAYTFPLARANEYEADRVAARLTSARTMAEALTGVRVVAQYLGERFWPAIFARADDEPDPTAAPYAHLGRDLDAQLAGADVQRWLGAAAAEVSSLDDTHPSLSARLQALGENPCLAPPAAGASAADAWLGDALARVQGYFDSRWQDHVTLDWRKRFDEVREGRGKLAALLAKEQTEGLTDDEAYQRALLEEPFGAGADAALAQLKALHARLPDAAGVCYSLGQRLLQRDCDEGAALIETAMRADDDALLAGLRLLRDWYWQRGDKARADELHARFLAVRTEQEGAAAERRSVTLRDTFDAHGLDAATLEALRAQLRGVAELKHAYLVRKRVAYLPQRPLYVLGFTTKDWWQRQNDTRARRVQQRIFEQVTFPGHAFVFCVEGTYRKFARKLRSVEDASVL